MPSIDQNRVYVVFEQDEVGHLLRDIQVIEFCEMKCIKGRQLPKKEGDWPNGEVVYIPLQSVRRIAEYASVEEYREVSRRYRDGLRKSQEKPTNQIHPETNGT